MWNTLRELLETATVAPERLEAASKILRNHHVIAADMTNPAPITQSNFARLPLEAMDVIDDFLLEVARRLLGEPTTNPRPLDADTWRRASSYLNKRLQVADKEAPGRAADLSEGAGAALREVLAELSQ